MKSGIEFNQLLWGVWHLNEGAAMEDILLLWTSEMVRHDVKLRTLNEMDGEGDTYNFIQDYHEGNVRAAFADTLNSVTNFKDFKSFDYQCNQFLNYKSIT